MNHTNCFPKQCRVLCRMTAVAAHWASSVDHSSSRLDSSLCWPPLAAESHSCSKAGRTAKQGRQEKFRLFSRGEGRMQMFLPLSKAVSSAPFPSSCPGCWETFPAHPTPRCKAPHEPVCRAGAPSALLLPGKCSFLCKVSHPK